MEQKCYRQFGLLYRVSSSSCKIDFPWESYMTSNICNNNLKVKANSFSDPNSWFIHQLPFEDVLLHCGRVLWCWTRPTGISSSFLPPRSITIGNFCCCVLAKYCGGRDSGLVGWISWLRRDKLVSYPILGISVCPPQKTARNAHTNSTCNQWPWAPLMRSFFFFCFARLMLCFRVETNRFN